MLEQYDSGVGRAAIALSFRSQFCEWNSRVAARLEIELIVRKTGALRLIPPLDQQFYQTCRRKLGWVIVWGGGR